MDLPGTAQNPICQQHKGPSTAGHQPDSPSRSAAAGSAAAAAAVAVKASTLVPKIWPGPRPERARPAVTGGRGHRPCFGASMRVGESARLDHDDVDFDQGLLTIGNTTQGIY